MPTYEYECSDCKRTFEVRQRITEAPLTTCEQCGGPIHRLLGPAAFILKGAGWYVTDYPSEARKKGRETEGGGAKESPAKESGKDAGANTSSSGDGKSSTAPTAGPSSSSSTSPSGGSGAEPA